MEVVLVGHSGGGMMLTELADHPSVQHSVYLAALWPQKGQSAAEMLGDQLLGWMVARDDGTVGVSGDLELVRQTLCADIDPERFAKEVHPRYMLTSLSNATTPSTAPPAQHPTTYIICDQDQALPTSPGSDVRRRRPRRPVAVFTLALPAHRQAAGKSPRRRRRLNLTQTCAVNMIAVQPACN